MRRDHARVIDEVITLKRSTMSSSKTPKMACSVARRQLARVARGKGGIFMDASGNRPKSMPRLLVCQTRFRRVPHQRGHTRRIRLGNARTLVFPHGHTGDHTVTIALIDNPGNPAFNILARRGYGLFAATHSAAASRSQAAAFEPHP